MGRSYLGIRKWCDRITALEALRRCFRVDARAFLEGWDEDVGRLGISRWLIVTCECPVLRNLLRLWTVGWNCLVRSR
jgi:hypothetical protein